MFTVSRDTVLDVREGREPEAADPIAPAVRKLGVRLQAQPPCPLLPA